MSTTYIFLLLSSTLQLTFPPANSQSPEYLNTDVILAYSIRQYTRLAVFLEGKESLGHVYLGDPSSQAWRYNDVLRWTVGFYGGTLWTLYKLTDDPFWKNLALTYQERVRVRANQTQTHDVGFVIMSTFGLALQHGKLTPAQKPEFEQVVHEAAKSLATRYVPAVGCTRSWQSSDHNAAPDEVLVIMDNMMNLELLYRAHEITGNTTFRQMAMNHADRTISEHFRPDGGCFHVIVYNQTDGTVVRKYNHQGWNRESTWGRGIAWAIHGYVTAFQKTGKAGYLQTAEKAIAYVVKGLPEDYVTWWDFDAPREGGQYQPRDTSAAAVMAHAFLNLFQATKNRTYLELAENVMEGLMTNYRADVTPEYSIPAILVNGTQFYHEDNMNTAIVYGDFYFLRAVDLHREIVVKLREEGNGQVCEGSSNLGGGYAFTMSVLLSLMRYWKFL